jgi:hypothetical protein
MTLFKPGHKPPHVTIAAFTLSGAKCRDFRGPARKKPSAQFGEFGLRMSSLMMKSSSPMSLL